MSCAAIDENFLIQSDIEKEDNAQEILDMLNDSELRKGKVFVFSNIQDGLWHYVRVNETEFYMRDQEVHLVEGAFFYFIENPRSRWNSDWVLNN